ncbi:MAG: MFS transporter [Acidimicrobiales bacterium]
MPRRILLDVTPLRESRDFRLLFTGQLISTLGNQMTVVAIPFQVYELSHSSLQVGAISLAQLVPFIVGAMLAGPIGDSSDRRHMMLWTAVALALTSAALALNASMAHPSLIVLYAISSLAAGFMGFSNTARSASVPGLVTRGQISAALAMTQIIIQVGTIVGPALSGLLLGIGLPLVFALDAGSFVVAFVMTVLMAPLPPGAHSGLSYWESTKEGLRYLKSRQALQGVYAVDINAMVFGLPRALFPAMRVHVFHADTVVLGLLYAAPGIGALIGAVTTGWVARLKRQGWAVIVAVVVWGTAIAFFGLVHVLWVCLVMLGLAGWADVISAVLRNTILQTSIPERLRSRMSSIQMAVVQGGPRLGDMEAGAVATATSLEFSIVSGGLACIAGAAVVGLMLPGFRRHASVDPGEIPV